MALDKSNPNRYLEDKEHKSKPKRPPRGAVVKKRNGDFRVCLTVEGIRVSVGVFKDRNQAIKAYWDEYNRSGLDD